MKYYICYVIAGLVLAAASYGSEQEIRDLTAGGKLVAKYQSAGVPKKPYIKELFTPSGVQVTVDSPPDHFHHHGLMFAVSAGGIDFWSEKPFEKFGSQVPRTNDTKVSSSGLKQKLDWIAPGGKQLLVESRDVKVSAPQAGGPNILTWSTVLEPATNKAVQLGGSHYFGLGMRFPADMNEKAKFILPEISSTDRVVRSDETIRLSPWCAATGEIGGKSVTVAMWDAPGNPRRAVWFTMTKPFSYLSATLDLDKQPYELKAGEKMALCYGVAVFDGIATASEIERVREAWLKNQ